MLPSFPAYLIEGAESNFSFLGEDSPLKTKYGNTDGIFEVRRVIQESLLNWGLIDDLGKSNCCVCMFLQINSSWFSCP